MLVRALRRGEADPRVRAYLAVAASLTAWLVVEVGVFASRYSDRIVERNLIALGPVLFIGLVLWLERGPTGSYVERAAVALAAAAVLLVLPVKRYVNVFGTHDAMTLIPIYKLLQATSPARSLAVYSAVAGVAAVAFALLPRRALRVVPVCCSRRSSPRRRSPRAATSPIRRARSRRCSSGADPRWVDHARRRAGRLPLRRRAGLERRVGDALLERRIDRVYVIGADEVPGPLPQARRGA